MRPMTARFWAVCACVSLIFTISFAASHYWAAMAGWGSAALAEGMLWVLLGQQEHPR